MLKKLPLAILAVSSVATAADNFTFDNSVSDVVIQDNVWENPAALLNTQNQIAATDDGTAGVVFEAMGQKIGIHAGTAAENGFSADNEGGAAQPDQSPTGLDIFWGGDLGAKTGVRFGYKTATESNQAESAFTPLAFTGPVFPTTEAATFEDAGGNKATISITDNVEKSAFTSYEFSLGQMLARGGYSVNFALPTFNNQRLVQYTTDTDLAADGAPNQKLSVTENTQASSGFSFETSAGFKQFFSRTFYLHGSAAYNSYNTNVVVESERIETIGSTETKTAEKEIRSDRASIIATGIGAGFIKRNQNSTVRIEGAVEYTRVAIDDRDNANEVHNTEAAKGEDGNFILTRNEIDLPLVASVEGSAEGSKFTWRVGAGANLVNFLGFQSSQGSYSETDDGKGFNLDYQQITGKGSALGTGAGVLVLGLGWAPVENLQVNAALNQAFLKDGFLDNGLASSLSASYSF